MLTDNLKHHSNVNVCKVCNKTHVIYQLKVFWLILEEPNEDTVTLFVISFIYVGGHSSEEPMFYVKVFQEDIVKKNLMKCEF